MQEEKIAAVQAKLEHAEQELAQFAKLPEMEEQLKQRMEALTQVRRPNRYAGESISSHQSNFSFLWSSLLSIFLFFHFFFVFVHSALIYCITIFINFFCGNFKSNWSKTFRQNVSLEISFLGSFDAMIASKFKRKHYNLMKSFVNL